MFGASLEEVWGEKKLNKSKKKKKIKQPLSPNEMESELLVDESKKREFKTNEYTRQSLLRDDRYINDTYKPVDFSNENIVSNLNPLGKTPKKLQDDPDYKEFLEFKKNKKIIPVETQNIDKNDQINELLLYVFTGFFFLILYDNIYKLGKNSY